MKTGKTIFSPEMLTFLYEIIYEFLGSIQCLPAMILYDKNNRAESPSFMN